MIVPVPIVVSNRPARGAFSDPRADWLASLPQDNVGTFYAKLRPPLMPFGIWFKVPVWGQVCDGREHRDAVGCFLHNDFPLRGRGWTYVAWRTEPDNPDRCKYPRFGKIANPQPHNGEPYWTCDALDASPDPPNTEGS